MLNVIHCNINDQPFTLAIDPGELLTDTLRGRCGLTSVKRGCGVGECGACTVLIDGVAMNSCIYLSAWADGKRIYTVEGLRAGPDGLHPVQRAFIEEAAIQCGFCTPGLIMTSVELVGNKRDYTREELRRLLAGHLCRCTGYENILNAVEKAINQRDGLQTL